MSIMHVAVETIKVVADLLEILGKDSEHEEKAKAIVDTFRKDIEVHTKNHG